MDKSIVSPFFLTHGVYYKWPHISTSHRAYIIYEKRSQEVVDRLRSSQTFEHYSARTEKFKKSFIQFCVDNYQ